jgi:hypothetical protein
MEKENINLKEYIDKLILHEKELREVQFNDSKLLVNAAKEKVDYQLEHMNKLRDQIINERSNLVLKDWFEKIHSLIEDRVKSLELSRSNWEGRIWAIGVGFTILQIVIGVVLHFVK